MANSIKSFLVINLLLSVTLVSTLAIVGNLFLEHQGFQKNLDSQLSLTAHTIYAFTDNTANFSSIQKAINKIDSVDTHSKESIKESIQFIVMDKDYNPIFQSKAVPQFSPNKFNEGFHNLWLNKRPWRLFYLDNKRNNYKIFTLQRHDFRASLEKQITEDSFIIMFITYPFLGLLIWAVVNKGLSGLVTATSLLQSRQRGNLSKLKIDSPPKEVAPLINAINSLLKRLDDAFQREQRFAGDAAHELRTPLAALSAHLQIAQEEQDIDKIKDSLKKVYSGVERSSHVVDQLLTLSRMSPGTEINAPEELDLSELVREIVIELFHSADKKNIEIELDADEKLQTIMGNKPAIMIMLRNLVDNALRYSPNNSKVTLTVKNKENAVSIMVSDQGPGIPDELKKRVFERFFRVVGNNTKGSGLGLGIVKQIINLHQAKAHLTDNNPGLNFEVIFNVQKK